MSRRARLGAFVVGSLLIFAAAIFLIGDKQFLFGRTYRLNAPFDNVAGLDEAAPVRAGGVRVGIVDRIQMPRQSGERVVVEMELDNSTREVIKKDSIATIVTEGLLGNKYVSISFGSKESESVRDGDVVQTQPPLDYSDLAKKANEIMDTTKGALGNVVEATGDLKSITSKIDRGQGTIGALVNDKEMYRNLNATTASARATVAEAKEGVVAFQENMEALKHNWFLRGFFKNRGYFDSNKLTEHVVAKVPNQPYSRKFAFNGQDLFDKPNTAKLKNEKLLDKAGKFLETNPFGLVVVVASTGLEGEKNENLTLSQARAMIVREHLARKFRIDDARIKTKGMGEASQTDKGGQVEIIVYSEGAESNIAEARAK